MSRLFDKGRRYVFVVIIVVVIIVVVIRCNEELEKEMVCFGLSK